MSDTPRITIVMPAFNEAEGLKLVLREVLAAADRVGERAAIAVLVVDDGSTDETREILARVSALDSRVRSVRHASTRGFGAAVRTALDLTQTRYAFMIPADGQWDPAELPAFVDAARDGVVLAMGVRDAREVYGASRRVLSAVYSILVRVLFRTSCRDFAWVHLYDLESARWREVEATSPFYPVEIALRTASLLPRNSPLVREIPSRMRERQAGTTKVANPRVVLRMLDELLTAAWRIRYRELLRPGSRKADPARVR